MALGSSIFEILQQPTIGSMLFELMVFMVPIWIAVCVGVLVGWVWRPKWANLVRESESVNHSSIMTCSNPLSPSSSCSSQSKGISLNSSEGAPKGKTFSRPSTDISACSTSKSKKEESGHVTEDDLEHLCRLVEMKDGGPAWIQMMDRSMPTMSYQAWRRDPETGPPQYRSRTVFEDATPELVRDFFWDDIFRPKWDDMLIHASTLEECPTTGTMMVKWVRKFPFFCSNREYVIGRRIWESGRSYYCVTKGVPNSVPRQNKPRRVDLYYSSWCIRAVDSNRGDGQLTSCEVLLFHHEDMGIPWEIAKLGVRQGMWGAVKKIEPGLRAYQKERAMGASLSRCAFMAQINSKVSADYLKSLGSSETSLSEIKTQEPPEKKSQNNIPKLLFVGGAIAIACSLDRGLVTKAVLFGVARRLGNIGRRI